MRIQMYLNEQTQDTDLTEIFYNNVCSTLPSLCKMSVLNNSDMPINIIDSYGVTTTYTSSIVSDRALGHLSLPYHFRGVAVIERRRITETDLELALHTLERHASKLKLMEHIQRLRVLLSNVVNPRKLDSYYVVSAITAERLKELKSLKFRAAGLVVSLYGQQPLTPLVEEGYLHKFEAKSIPEKSLLSNIVYYNREPSKVFVNILGTVYVIDSIIPDTDSMNEYVQFEHRLDGISDLTNIRSEDFNKNKIYRTLREAKYAMCDDSLLANRKLDLEYLKTESGIVMTAATESFNNTKYVLELISKSISMSFEREKNLLALKQLKEKEKQSRLDTGKKIIDTILMIAKLFT